MGSTYGFIILPREEALDCTWFDDPWELGSWVILVARARGIPGNDLLRAQLRASYREIARWLKTTEDRVRRFIKKLVRLGKVAVDLAAGAHASAVYRITEFSRYNGEQLKPSARAGSRKSATPTATLMLFKTEGVTEECSTQAATQEIPVDETRARVLDNVRQRGEVASSPQSPSSPKPDEEEKQKPREHTVVIASSSMNPAVQEVQRLTNAVIERFGIPAPSARQVVLLGLLRGQLRQRIQSPDYFRHIVEELVRRPLPSGYTRYLEYKLEQFGESPARSP